jgi:hypothetical protein
MKNFQIDRSRARFDLVASENPGRSFEALAAPLRDLVRMHVELLRQFRHRLLALDCGQSYLRLESRRVVPGNSFRHLRS